MSAASESLFVEELLAALRPLGGVSGRRMFGGWGIYQDALMFGLVADGVFYLKAGPGNTPGFEAEGLPPFTYERDGRPAIIMSYRQAPERALEQPAVMRRWAQGAIAEAQAAAAKKPKKPRVAAKKKPR